MGCNVFRGIEKFSGRVKIIGGVGGLIFYHEGLGFFGRGWDLVRLFEVVSVTVKQFSLEGEEGKNFSGD